MLGVWGILIGYVAEVLVYGDYLITIMFLEIGMLIQENASHIVNKLDSVSWSIQVS